MKKAVIIIVLLLVIGGVGAYLYVFYKPHRNITAEEAGFTESATSMVEAFKSDAETANAVYLDNVGLVSGVAIEVADDHITLKGGVYCTLANDVDQPRVQEGDEVEIKGRVVGYDELFGEVRMDFCEVQ